ncbi:NUDIX hydrolase [Pigmentiphaga soli]|uniref:NUDIX hydrolase n=1 Tax=Pigmentiphaga soli TaxID=1007095 RepID=A0ABP8GRM8_9BURK
MDTRSSSRLLVLDARDRILLFRFVHRRGPLAGRDFWATPGGGLEHGEDFEAAARRELHEETGFKSAEIGPPIARRCFEMQMPDGTYVLADERFFVVRVQERALSRDGWTDLERDVMAEHRWWTLDELRTTRDAVFLDDILAILAGAGISPALR